MNRRTNLALLFSFATLPSVVLAAPEIAAATRAAATEWLQKVDSANYSGSWESAAPIFKAAVSVQAWEKSAQSVRVPLGAVRRRSEKSASPTNNLPGVPDGNYVIFQYDTTFENKAAAIETLTLAQDRDGSWHVAGYFIK